MPPQWSSLIAKAEKLLGGPAPFINLSSLMSSEAGFLASHARRLAATTDHPFFETVRACLNGKSLSSSLLPFSQKLTINRPTSSSPYPPGGLIILLVGQCRAGDLVGSTVLSSQHRNLAELFETVHLAVNIHKSLVHPKKENRVWSQQIPGSEVEDDETWMKNMELGNKLATLTGDMLLASVSTTLAHFHNAKIVDVVSEAIGDMLQAEFYSVPQEFFHGPVTTEDHAKVPKPTPHELSSNSHDQNWLQYIGSCRGSILGCCCQSAVLLSEARLQLPANEDQMDKQHKSALFARQLGQDWATLLRLIEERDFVRRNQSDIQKRLDDISKPAEHSTSGYLAPGSFINYVEGGLPEPALIDLYLGEHIPVVTARRSWSSLYSTVDCTTAMRHYDQLGAKISDRLKNSFSEFRSCIIDSGSTPEKATLSAIDLLRDMVLRLSEDSSH